MTEPASLKSVLEQLAEAEKARAEPHLNSRQRRARTVARLAAVQALYRLDHTPDDAELVRIAEAWRPFRTWATVALRAVGSRLPATPAARPAGQG